MNEKNLALSNKGPEAKVIPIPAFVLVGKYALASTAANEVPAVNVVKLDIPDVWVSPLMNSYHESMDVICSYCSVKFLCFLGI